MRRSNKEILKEMRELADKYKKLEDEVEALLKRGEDMEDVAEQKNQEQLSDIINTVGVIMDEIDEIEKEYNKRTEEVRANQ